MRSARARKSPPHTDNGFYHRTNEFLVLLQIDTEVFEEELISTSKNTRMMTKWSFISGYIILLRRHYWINEVIWEIRRVEGLGGSSQKDLSRNLEVNISFTSAANQIIGRGLISPVTLCTHYRTEKANSGFTPRPTIIEEFSVWWAALH